MFYSRKRSFLPNILFIIPIILMVFIFANTATYATEFGRDFSSNSVIELNEVASGDYRNKVIKITTLNGETTLTIITDGNKKVESKMPYEVCEALWNHLIEKDVGYLEDAIGGALPDTSTFTLKVSVGNNSHTVMVEGVDSLIDTRSRDIVREIIRVSEMHAPKDTE